jgi:hypothetical protein
MKADTFHFQTPGLYLKGLETDPNPPTLSAVTGFVGAAEKGPPNQPQPIRNWGEFREIFGEVVPYSYLAPSVFGFFLNGGELCYIVRVADTANRTTRETIGDCEKTNPLRKASIAKKIETPDGDTGVSVEAIDEGSWGNQVKVEILVKTDGKTRFIFTYKDRKETFSNLSLNPNHPDYFVDIINGEPDITDYIQRSKNGHSILVNVEHITNPVEIYSLTGFTEEPVMLEGGGDGFVNAEGLMKDKSNLDSLEIVSKKKGNAGNQIRVQAVPFTTKTALRIADDTRNRLIVENIKYFLDESQEDFDETLVGESLTISSDTVPGENGVIHSIEKEHTLILARNVVGDFPVGSVVSIHNRFNIIVRDGEKQEPQEIFCNLSMNPNSSRYFENIINHKSLYICVHKVKKGGNQGPPGEGIHLTGGKNPGEIDYRYYTGYEDDVSYYVPQGSEPGKPLGVAALENIPDVSLVAVPDLARMDHDSLEYENIKEDFNRAQTHILYHCRKMGERFAVLDPMLKMDIEALPNFQPKEATFGALYYPWLYCTTAGKKMLLPPSGYIAGIMAQTDRTYGINKAPANVKIKGVVDLEIPIDRAMQDKLNNNGINCIRKFEDGQIKVWGSRTLSMETKWRYVNVRRIFLNMIKVLSTELLWAVFEPNSPNLWQQIEAAVTAFLNTMVVNGMTAGANTEEAFYVKCNEETNTKEIIEAGQVIAEVGVALTAPAEFIIITVKRTPESLSIIEEDT